MTKKYQITLKGLIGQDLLDAVELYALRNGYNAVLLKEGGSFINVERIKDGAKNKKAQQRVRH